MDSKELAAVKKRFGARMRELRLEQGFSQESFAEACDLHRTYIGAIERGERNVSLENIFKISKALSLKMSDLLA